MAKNAKKLPTNHNKPITAFFTRASKGPSSFQDARSSPAKKASSASLEVTGDISSSITVTSSLANASKPTSRTSNVATRAQSTQGRSVDTQAALMTPSASSLKRSRSPDIQPSKLPTPQKASQNTKSRQRSKFDSDSEPETRGVVVYVKATVGIHLLKMSQRLMPFS